MGARVVRIGWGRSRGNMKVGIGEGREMVEAIVLSGKNGRRRDGSNWKGSSPRGGLEGIGYRHVQEASQRPGRRRRAKVETNLAIGFKKGDPRT